MLDKNPETRITVPEIKVTDSKKKTVILYNSSYSHCQFELSCCLYFYVCMSLQLHPWVTENGSNPLPLEEEHCTAVEVTEEEVQNSVKLITSLSTVVSHTSLPL